MANYYKLTDRQLRYLKRVAKAMNLQWQSLAAKPTTELTAFIIACCDAGTPSTEVPALWLELKE